MRDGWNPAPESAVSISGSLHFLQETPSVQVAFRISADG